MILTAKAQAKYDRIQKDLDKLVVLKDRFPNNGNFQYAIQLLEAQQLELISNDAELVNRLLLKRKQSEDLVKTYSHNLIASTIKLRNDAFVAKLLIPEIPVDISEARLKRDEIRAKNKADRVADGSSLYDEAIIQANEAQFDIQAEQIITRKPICVVYD